MYQEDLNQYIQSNPDPRELKRAVAVKMWLDGYKHYQIQNILGVSSGFISKWTDKYEHSGIEVLKLKYLGSNGYLNEEQRQQINKWLKEKNYWSLSEVKTEILVRYNVKFESNQSYYDMLNLAGISWKKSQKSNPKEDQELVEKKKQEIIDWLEINSDEIQTGELAVFFEDECHLLWGDTCGYIWGKKEERVEIPMVNERIRQTYYGAVNILNQKCISKKYEGGNSKNTIDFIKYLLSENKGSRIAIIWDGASYHRSEEIREYLQSLNEGLEETKWKVTCIRFAPNCPKQNPMEDIWLQGKRFIREFYHLCKSFKIVRYLFEFSTNNNIFNFPKMFMYGNFSQMI